MIRLVVATDETQMIGVRNPEDNPARMGTWPKGLTETFFPEYYQGAVVTGSSTYFPFFHEAGSKDAPIYVLNYTEDFDLRGNQNAEVVTDFIKVVEKYKESDELLIVAGGKMTWELFLPYVDEIKVGYTKKPMVPGDIKFDAWLDVNKEEVSRVKWDGGETITYKVI